MKNIKAINGCLGPRGGRTGGYQVVDHTTTGAELANDTAGAGQSVLAS